jgi:hypothetical protein
MRYKASFLSGLAAGYVLGARAGRERYERLRNTAQSFWANPQVQNATGTMQNRAGQFMGSAARVAADKGKAVSQKVSDKMPSRISDKLHVGRHREESWQSYAHAGSSGHNGHITSTGSSSGPGPGPTVQP